MIQSLSPRQAKHLREAAVQFCRLLKPPEKIKPSEWAEKYRRLRPGRSREPGPWRNSRSPHLVGIMDAAVEPGVRQIVVVKGARIGYSEAWKNALGYWIDCEPDPVMFVLPDRESVDKIVQGDIRPLLDETPRLRRYLSPGKSDNKLTLTRLSTMEVATAWAGSPQSLASSNQRRVLFDETDKFPPFSGREANPIDLGMARANTYDAIGRAFFMLGSTPTTRSGHIWKQAEACTQHRRWHAPCPECGKLQQVVWSQIKWSPQRDGEDRLAWAERIRETREVWYECKHCQHRIREEHKPRMMRAGKWVADDATTSNARVAFYAPSFISLMLSWAQLASEFIRAKGDPGRMMHFANSSLGEPFEEQSSAPKADTFRDKIKLSGPPLVAPPWARVIFLTADVQKGHSPYVIRAWGYGFRSALLRYGLAASLEELSQLGFTQGVSTSTGEWCAASYIGLDSRYRTDEVLAFAARDPGRVLPFLGAANPVAMPITEQSVKGYPGVIRRTVNPNYWKDRLHGLIHDNDPTLWLVHNQIGDDYCRQMASEHKVYDPKGEVWLWQEVSQGADNHFWDCEVLQCVLAQMGGVGAFPEDTTPPKPPNDDSRVSASEWLNRGKKW